MELTQYHNLYSYLNTHQYPTNLSPRDRKQLNSQSQHFIIYNNQLFKKPRKPKKQLIKVITRGELEPLLDIMHSHPTSGHLGTEATFQRLKDKYYWPQMYNDIKAYVTTCDNCQRFGRPIRTEPLHTIPVGQPFERIGIDIVGPLPRTARGNRYIVVAVDYLTKWPEARALSTASAEAVTNFIYDDIICRHGAPQTILSDQGTHFKNQMIKHLCEKFKTKHRLSSPYHLQTNGMVERLNRTLGTALGKLRDTMNWDEYLPAVLFAYRTHKHNTTRFTPFFLLYGREAKLPVEITENTTVNEFELNNTIIQRAFEIVDQLPTSHEITRNNIKKSQKQQEVRHLTRLSRIIKYKPGDLVLMYDSKLDKQWSGKLDTKWKGPFKVYKCLNKGAYVLHNQFGQPLKEVVHADRLKPYHARANWQLQIEV
jgi:hypothetical protein